MSENLLPFATLARLRMATDGVGVTTLIAAFGCPLRCKMCINAYAQKIPAECKMITCEELYEKTSIDSLYFLATGGGLTFGGGESLLHADYIAEFAQMYQNGWKLNVETSLHVSREQIDKVLPFVDTYIVDTKSLNAEIYQEYTGASNDTMLNNLTYLLKKVGPDRIVVRDPLIPELKDELQQKKEADCLREMGFTQIDCFSYVDPEEHHNKMKRRV